MVTRRGYANACAHQAPAHTKSMTTEIREVLRCAVCSDESEYMIIGSTNMVGYPDLDTRPPEMRRSTIFAWVQRCPNCGYCATEIFNPCATAASEIASAPYKRQLHDAAFPALANSFLCKAMLDKARGDLAAATWAHIHAAWACDDANRQVQARSCRRSAADLLVQAEANGQKVCDQVGLSTAVLADLLRRTGDWKTARRALARPLKTKVESIVKKLCRAQAHLIDNHDMECHSVAQAFRQIRMAPSR